MLTKMEANPLRTIRKSAGLTQQQVAIAGGITPQVVLKAEQGLYGMVPPKLISVLSEIGAVAESDLEIAYKEWQKKRRFANREVVLSALADVSTGAKLSYKDFREVVGGSVNSFCRVLCLHPAQWNRLEKSGGDSGFFLEALKEAELEWLMRLLG